MGRLDIRVDEGLCCGAQRCVYLLPEVFELGSQGYAEVLDPSAASEESVIQVAAQCPNFAITVLRDGYVLVGE
jgi:ferredoxin